MASVLSNFTSEVKVGEQSWDPAVEADLSACPHHLQFILEQ